MAHRAVTHVHIGRDGHVQPGEVIPDTFVDTVGDEHPVDFDRLVALGAAEEIKPPKRKPAGDPPQE